MDNELTVFQCHHQRVQLATQEWLIQWQLPEWPGIVCPSCGADSISKLMSRKGRKTHVCQECRHTFSLDDVPGCHCTFPGLLLKCATCKHYLDLVRYVNRRLPALQELSDEEIEKRFDPKKYAQRDMTRRAKLEPLAPLEPTFPEDVAQSWVQLSFLEEDDGKPDN
jgi:hypothetical protein